MRAASSVVVVLAAALATGCGSGDQGSSPPSGDDSLSPGEPSETFTPPTGSPPVPTQPPDPPPPTSPPMLGCPGAPAGVPPAAPIEVAAPVAAEPGEGLASGSDSDSCAGIEPLAEMPMQQHVKNGSEYCLPAAGDGTGVLALPRYPHGPSYPHVSVGS